MIKELNREYIKQVAQIHRDELSGFLPEMGTDFLSKFYKSSLSIPEIFTFVEVDNDKVLGFVTGVTNAEGLYKKIVLSDPVAYALIFLKHVIIHPASVVRLVRILFYPGFNIPGPELLTIAVSKSVRKIGIGTKLFDKTKAEFKKRGISKFKISVYERLPANKFYRKLGCKYVESFMFLGEKMNYYGYEIENK